MKSGANRNKQNLFIHKRNNWLLSAALAVLLLLPATAFAASVEVKTQEDLIAALDAEQPAVSIKFAADLSTDASLTVPEGTVIDLDGYTWTVEIGTVAAEQNTVVGGSFTAGKNGTIRVLQTVALESAMTGEVVKSVTYTDGETDDSANYIAGHPVAADYTVRLYLKNGKTVSRVTTAQASYRIGSADPTRLSLVYGISYNLDGGKVENGANPTEYTASDTAITLINPIREGYTFLGWTGTGLTEPTETVTIAMRSTGNRSYTALWEEVSEEELPSQGGSGGAGSRPTASGSGSSLGGGFSGLGGLSGSLNIDTATEEAETTETVAEEQPTTAAQNAPNMQQNSRRISTASSSVKVEFSGAKPVMETVRVGDDNPRIDLPKLLTGAGLLLVSLAGAILLIKKKD